MLTASDTSTLTALQASGRLGDRLASRVAGAEIEDLLRGSSARAGRPDGARLSKWLAAVVLDAAASAGRQQDVGRRSSMDWFAHGYECKGQGDLDGARAAFEQALSGAHGPMTAFSRAGAYRALGELAEGGSDLETAMDYYRRALAEDPNVGVSKRLAALARRPSRVVRTRL